MKKRVFASFMAMAMAATMLTGCGGDKPAANGSGSGAAAGGRRTEHDPDYVPAR